MDNYKIEYDGCGLYTHQYDSFDIPIEVEFCDSESKLPDGTKVWMAVKKTAEGEVLHYAESDTLNFHFARWDIAPGSYYVEFGLIFPDGQTWTGYQTTFTVYARMKND